MHMPTRRKRPISILRAHCGPGEQCIWRFIPMLRRNEPPERICTTHEHPSTSCGLLTGLTTAYARICLGCCGALSHDGSQYRYQRVYRNGLSKAERRDGPLMFMVSAARFTGS